MSSQKRNTMHSDTNCCNWYKMLIELRLLQCYHNTVSKDGKVFIRDKEKVTEFTTSLDTARFYVKAYMPVTNDYTIIT